MGDSGQRPVVTGAFYANPISESATGSSSSSSGNYKYGFDASRSNSIYGNSTTVQPPAVQLIPQIKF